MLSLDVRAVKGSPVDDEQLQTSACQRTEWRAVSGTAGTILTVRRPYPTINTSLRTIAPNCLVENRWRRCGLFVPYLDTCLNSAGNIAPS